MYLKQATKISVETSPGKGLGCFAIEDIYEGEVIEECHLLEIPGTSIRHDNSLFVDYRFNSPTQGGPGAKQVLPLGNGCIYNHSDNNNAAWRNHPRYRAFQFYAIKDIKVGEEVCTYYGGDKYWEQRPHIKKI